MFILLLRFDLFPFAQSIQGLLNRPDENKEAKEDGKGDDLENITDS